MTPGDLRDLVLHDQDADILVVVGAPSDGDAPIWNASTGEWEPGAAGASFPTGMTATNDGDALLLSLQAEAGQSTPILEVLDEDGATAFAAKQAAGGGGYFEMHRASAMSGAPSDDDVRVFVAHDNLARDQLFLRASAGPDRQLSGLGWIFPDNAVTTIGAGLRGFTMIDPTLGSGHPGDLYISNFEGGYFVHPLQTSTTDRDAVLQYIGPNDQGYNNAAMIVTLNEAGNALTFRVLYSNGSTLKTGTVALT